MRRGLADAGQEGYIVQFAHDAFEAHPVGSVAAGEVDDREAATRLGAFRDERVVERQALEGAIIPRQRQSDDGAAAGEGEAARVARTEGDGHKAARRRVDPA